MPRQPRLEFPGIPLHITQRGVNRCAIYVDDEDREHYDRPLCDATREHGITAHAPVFMDNHIHPLLSSPLHDALSRTMRNVDQCYVQAFNRRHRRLGTLWQGRFKSCLVDSERHLLTVYRYIEMNPVRAAMVEPPQQHRWSSVHVNLRMQRDALVTPHPAYLALDKSPAVRAQACGEWLRQGVGEDELQRTWAHLQKERALGDRTFQALVERALGRPVAARSPGRPGKPIDALKGE